jgi:hypothetical protein
MPEADHCGIPLAIAVALGGIDQLANFPLGEMLTRSKLGIQAAHRHNCPFFYLLGKPVAGVILPCDCCLSDVELSGY